MTALAEAPKSFRPEFGRYELLKTTDLHIDGTYQRPISPWRVRDIVFNFEPILYQPLIIGFRKGVYYVIDGQHRREAAIQLNFTKVPCMVYDTKSVSEEARAFLWLQDKRRVISYPQKFVARIAMKDAAAVAISELLVKHGFEINQYDGFRLQQKNNVITAVASLQYAYDFSGEKMVDNILYILRNAWDGSADCLSMYMIRGLTAFMLEFKAFNRKDLANKLSALTAREIATAAGSVSRKYGMHMIDAHAYVIRNIDIKAPLTARQDTEVE